LTLILVAMVLLLPSSKASAYQPTQASQVYATCLSQLSADRERCVVYLTAALDAYVTLGTMGYLQGNPICLPSGIDDGRVLDVFVRFLEAHPGRGDVEYSAFYLVLDAFYQAFPCEP
jgi:hypothetical protein